MPDLSTDSVVGWFDALFQAGMLGNLSDAQLLDRFESSETTAEAAFEVLLNRHGPMVLGVCRRILGDVHAADDAFQATFLVLVSRARTVHRRESLGPWLHGVARRVSLRSRAADRLRREREARAAIDLAAGVMGNGNEADEIDSGIALHDEIDRLPEKYRAPIVLCYLQGRTIAEAADQLGWPVGTVGGRLARARDQLRDRLERRGLVPAAFAAAMDPEPAVAALAARSLARSTRQAAIQLATGRAATGVVSATVANLLRETIQTMIWTRLMIVTSACSLLAVLTFGAVGMSLPAGAPEPPIFQAKEPTSPGKPAGERLDRKQTLQRASQAISTLTDVEERVDVQIALAWSQIKSGDQAGARATLDRAAEASNALDAEKRCASRVRIAVARGEAGDRPGGISSLTLALQDIGLMPEPRSWVLKSVALAQCELGEREAARATIQALGRSILTPEQRRNGGWSSRLTDLCEAQIAVGDHDEAFRTCIPGLPPGGANRQFQVALRQQPWMLMKLASAAAESGRYADDPPRIPDDEERAARLAIVRRAVAAVEELPEANERRPILAASLAVLGAFDEALAIARRIDQKQIRGQSVDATWAMSRIVLEQVKKGKLEDARMTAREAAELEKTPEAEDDDYQKTQANGLIAAREFDAALRFAETLKPYARAEILAHIAGQKRRDGDRAGSEPIFRRALEVAEQVRKGPPTPRRRIPARADGQAEDLQTWHQVESLALLATIHGRAGDLAAATKALTAMPEGGRMKGLTAFRIAAMRARSGDPEGALDWALALPTSSLRAWAIRGLAFSIYSDRAEQL